jgi:hypothetical protein
MAVAKVPYYNVCTISVKPENQAKVVEFFEHVAAETAAKEPAAQIYRYYKVEKKDEFVIIEKSVRAVHDVFPTAISNQVVINHD